MVNARYLLVVLVVAVVSACATDPTQLAFSRRDHTTKWWGDDTNYGPRVHYVHVVRDSAGHIKDVYRYYRDEKDRPVLDGPCIVSRGQHAPELIIEYRDGREIRRSEVIVRS